VLTELTRRGATDSTTVSTTLLQYACDDIQSGDFPTYVQTTYDSTNRQHVSVACEGVLAKLKLWARDGSDGGKAEWDRWVARAQALARVTGRDRILPTTTSELEPTAEVDGTEVVRPMFDQADFDEYRPGP
jgi:hypothetical protein